MSQIIYLCCEKCFLKFDNKYELDQHLALVHGEEINVKEEPAIKEESFEELQKTETELEKPYECNFCSAAFPTKSCLNRHVIAVHEGNKSFQCKVCEYSFADKGKLKEHIASVHERKKPFQCNTCDANFAKNTKLK